jgi:mannobiose 2-epimerase
VDSNGQAAALANEMLESLWNDLLGPWFPRCVSPEGGFDEEFGRDWTPGNTGSRSLVFQSRMIWTCAKAAETGASAYEEHALHGLSFLADKMAAREPGEYQWATTKDGAPRGVYSAQRHVYGSAFAIYALAATAKAFRSDRALTLAKQAFEWIENRLYDPVSGGYFECCDDTGKPILSPTSELEVDGIGTPYGLKSQNSHLHLLEAFAELHRVWPDPHLKKRLQELLDIFLDRLYVEPGWLHCFVQTDWTPVPGYVSHGHDVEAAHLILDAAGELGLAEDQAVTAKTRALIDYALANGWDGNGGGFYNSGTPDGRVSDHSKIWWVQAEGLLGLTTLLSRTGDPKYREALESQWAWIRNHQVDHEFGGWWECVDRSGLPIAPLDKGHAWKAAYHDGRALLQSSRLLNAL